MPSNVYIRGLTGDLLRRHFILYLGFLKGNCIGAASGLRSCDVMTWFLLAKTNSDISRVVYIGKKPSL